MDLFDRVMTARFTWERAHGKRAKTVHVPCAVAADVQLQIIARDAFTAQFDAQHRVTAVGGMDWYEDPTLSGDDLRFES